METVTEWRLHYLSMMKTASQLQWMGAIRKPRTARFCTCVYISFLLKEKKAEFLGEISHHVCQKEHIQTTRLCSKMALSSGLYLIHRVLPHFPAFKGQPNYISQIVKVSICVPWFLVVSGLWVLSVSFNRSRMLMLQCRYPPQESKLKSTK